MLSTMTACRVPTVLSLILLIITKLSRVANEDDNLKQGCSRGFVMQYKSLAKMCEKRHINRGIHSTMTTYYVSIVLFRRPLIIIKMTR